MSRKMTKPPPNPTRNTPKERPGQPGSRRAKNREEKTRVIATAALELLLERGIESVTIDQIVKRSGIAKGSFYRYFKDKTDLVEALIEPIGTLVCEALDECVHAVSVATRKQELLSAYVKLAGGLSGTFTQHPNVARLYLQECRAPDVGARKPIGVLADNIIHGAISLTHAAQEHGLQRPVIAQVSANAVVGAVEKLILAHLNGSLDQPPDQIYSTLITLVVDGLRGDRAR